ncbi:MAG: putative porin, partial [Muribaculaceae bacterium]|nr:putative porin [Muribaculaceae bacterium]
ILYILIVMAFVSTEASAKKPTILEPSYSWTASQPLGLRVPSSIDTLQYNYHREFVPSMSSDAWASTGNFGCAGINQIFFERKESSEFIFADALEHWIPNADNQKFYNTRIPMTLLSYSWGGGRESGQDRLKGIFSGNAGKRIQVGAMLDYLYSKGGYDRQALKDFVWGFSGSYTGDRYELQASVATFNSVNHESGGIKDDAYITDPASLQGGDPNIDAKAIPVNLSSAFSRVKGSQFRMNHRYKVGYYEEEQVNDSTINRTYIPVSSFIWTFDYKTNTHKFVNENATEDGEYFENSYLSVDGTNEETKYWRIRNTIGIDMLEGFNKYAKFGLSAYATHEVRRYTQVCDTMLTSSYKPENLTPFPEFDIEPKTIENLLWVGGQLTKQRGSILTYGATAQFGIVGSVAGDIDVSGHLSTHIPLLGDTVSIVGEGFFRNTEASFLLKNYISNHFAWKNDFGKIRRFRVGGRIEIPRFGTTLSAGVENLQNYVYFNTLALPEQEGGSVQVFSASLSQNFRLGILHWNNRLTYQTSSNESVLPLPKLAVYSDLFLSFTVSKVLKINLGVDCNYYTNYYAPAYQPSTMSFYNQTEKKLGNCPFMNAYADMKLSKTRFFVMYSHLNQGMFGGNNYFAALHYPMNPSRFQLGISVDFAN